MHRQETVGYTDRLGAKGEGIALLTGLDAIKTLMRSGDIADRQVKLFQLIRSSVPDWPTPSTRPSGFG